MIHRIKDSLKRKLSKPGWYGDYESWAEALKDCTGYESKLIVEKVKDALLKVKNGQAAFERDLLTVQKVHPSIYLGSYRSWFFNKATFLQFLTSKYEITETFQDTEIASVPSVFKGLIAQRKNNP